MYRTLNEFLWSCKWHEPTNVARSYSHARRKTILETSGAPRAETNRDKIKGKLSQKNGKKKYRARCKTLIPMSHCFSLTLSGTLTRHSHSTWPYSTSGSAAWAA